MENKEQAETQDSPGSLLRSAREEKGLSEREAADRMNWVPSYVGIIENNDYAALRSPALARGYIKAYGRLLGLGEAQLMSAFDSASADVASAASIRRAPLAALPAQKAGLAIVLCLATLILLVFALWWWRAGVADQSQAESSAISQQPNTTAGDL